ncbi:ABC transporter substrate-binding protein [Ammoniphilus sp. YIM 78166]|uniref:ABC transporter substrate-binding protein n=1 Tax=Ammoniphilus sp. YIM 78166 TaxID=1644106 RepID=UPI00142F7E98|nr:ABC transporter substrate-binding protein [Ammoniphilus sp. YIM 78166]
MFKKNKWVKSSVALILSSSILVGCGGQSNTSTNPEPTAPTSGKEYEGRTLTIASYGGALDEAMKKYVIDKFEQETGAKVVLDPAYQYAKLLSEQGSPSVDLIYLDDARVIEGGKVGVLEQLDSSKVSEWNNLYPQAVDKGNFGLAWVFGSYGIVYNKDQIKEAPTSWADLWKEDYKGKIAVNDLVSNGGVQAFVAAGKLDGGDDKNLEPAFDRFKKLAPNLLTVSASTAQLTDMLTRGDVWIAPWWDGRALNLEDKVSNIGFVRPEEGAYATIVMLSIPKNAQNQDMAYKFLNMALNPEAQVGFSQDMYYGPTNKNTKLPEELAQRVVYGEEEIEKLQFVDWDHIATVRSQLIDRWNQEIVPLLK